MAEKLCNAYRCIGVQQVKTEQNNSRCSDNKTIEYWIADNDQSLTSITDMKFRSGGTSEPQCNNNQVREKFEDLAVGQQNCVGYRNGSGKTISLDNDEILIHGGKNSFIHKLYSQINIELNARKKHGIYENLSTLTSPTTGNSIKTTDLNNALEIIKAYYDADYSDLSDYNYVEVTEKDLVTKNQLSDIMTEFNENVIQDCICYSDCQGYAVCYCYGNCSYY